MATADVFLTNMRPQFLRRAGLDHEQLLAANPKLVYGILTGYGLVGPDKDAPGFDMAAFSARSGVSHRATPPGGVPPTLPGGMGDNVTAIALVAGILGALVNRERTGRGPARLDVAPAHGHVLRRAWSCPRSSRSAR